VAAISKPRLLTLSTPRQAVAIDCADWRTAHFNAPRILSLGAAVTVPKQSTEYPPLFVANVASVVNAQSVVNDAVSD